MMPLMYYGLKQGVDLTVFIITQMFYPAAGVMLAKLTSYNEGKLPKAAYITTIVTTVLGVIASVLCVTVPQTMQSPLGEVELYASLMNYVVMLATILFFIFICVAGKEARENAGFRFKNPGKSIGFIFLFLVLYFGRMLIAFVIDGIQTGDMATSLKPFVEMFTSPMSIAIWITILINLPLTFLMFLGEEYGWRYFLQPVMQKKFGMKLGVILLGVVWGLWHMPVDTMFYTKDSIPQMIVGQIITCVSLGIFLGYAYLKTNNIWIPVAMHFLNNNLIPVVSGSFTAESIQDQTVSWTDLLIILVIDIVVFCLFIFTKEYKEKKETQEESVNA